jgi:hypothetical protein
MPPSVPHACLVFPLAQRFIELQQPPVQVSQ